MACPASRINEALWGALNQTVISGHEDGSLRLWDVVSLSTHPAIAHGLPPCTRVQPLPCCLLMPPSFSVLVWSVSLVCRRLARRY